MICNYLIYFFNLTKEKKVQELVIILGFWIVLFLVVGIYSLIRRRHLRKDWFLGWIWWDALLGAFFWFFILGSCFLFVIWGNLIFYAFGLWEWVDWFLNFSEIKGFSWYFSTFGYFCVSNICVILGHFLRISSPTFPQLILYICSYKNWILMGNLKFI